MYLKNITINNFKRFSDTTVQFEQGVNLLLGDNGAGKTSILDAIIVALGGYLSGITGIKSKGIIQKDIKVVSSDITSVSKTIKYQTPTEIRATFDVDGKEMNCSRARDNQTGDANTRTRAHELKAYAVRITNSSESILPIILHLSVSRETSKRGDFGIKTKNTLNDRRCGYIGCLDERSYINGIEQWCLDMEMEAFRQEKPIHEYEVFKAIVSQFMQRMNELDDSPQIFYNKHFDEIVYSERGRSFPITYLSAGYQSLLLMIMNIAYRLVTLNPTVSDYKEVPGIILIDDVDNHLQPKWQRNIIDVLASILPKAQFIIVTHSPIVVSSCQNGYLINLDNDNNVTYPPQPYAFSA